MDERQEDDGLAGEAVLLHLLRNRDEIRRDCTAECLSLEIACHDLDLTDVEPERHGLRADVGQVALMDSLREIVLEGEPVIDAAQGLAVGAVRCRRDAEDAA